MILVNLACLALEEFQDPLVCQDLLVLLVLEVMRVVLGLQVHLDQRETWD